MMIRSAWRLFLAASFHLLLAFVLLLCADVAWAQAKYKIIHAFGAPGDGSQLLGSVVLDKAGNIYGTTYGGGANLCGTVFELTPGSNGPWTEQQLHSFSCYEMDGFGPRAGVTLDTAGNLYGTTYSGSENGGGGDGTVFELTPGSNGWTETILHSFNGSDGSGPNAGVTLDSQGNLYGTTITGGGYECGTAFELVKGSGGWTFAVLHDFRVQNINDGCGLYSGVIVSKSGNILGTTGWGGTANLGVVYALIPNVDGTWQEQTYNCGACGASVSTGVPAKGSTNTLYGTATYGGVNTCGGSAYYCGSIWQLSHKAGGQVTSSTLYNFQTGVTGSLPVGGVVRDTAGNLYGTTSNGGGPSQSCGPNGCGVVYELVHQADGTWVYKVLHTFNYSDGGLPDANLTLDGKGHIFGTTQIGGPYGLGGVVFEIGP